MPTTLRPSRLKSDHQSRLALATRAPTHTQPLARQPTNHIQRPTSHDMPHSLEQDTSHHANRSTQSRWIPSNSKPQTDCQPAEPRPKPPSQCSDTRPYTQTLVKPQFHTRHQSQCQPPPKPFLATAAANTNASPQCAPPLASVRPLLHTKGRYTCSS